MHALHFLFSFKSGDRVAIFAFLPPFSGLIPPNVLGIGQSYFVHPQTVLQICIPFQRSYRPTGLLFMYSGM